MDALPDTDEYLIVLIIYFVNYFQKLKYNEREESYHISNKYLRIHLETSQLLYL